MVSSLLSTMRVELVIRKGVTDSTVDTIHLREANSKLRKDQPHRTLDPAMAFDMHAEGVDPSPERHAQLARRLAHAVAARWLPGRHRTPVERPQSDQTQRPAKTRIEWYGALWIS